MIIIMSAPIRVKKLSDTATIPTRGSAVAAGWDLYASQECIIPARGKAIVSTDIAIAVPVGYYGRVAPRSGMAWKKHTDIGAGVIDADYRGPVGVVMFNHSEEDLKIEVEDRVAQLVIEQISMAPLTEVESLDDTERGEGGYGSTGR
ncbi:MAG: dUTP diphosphatase [Flavobacteriaceae bacterium]|nr:dUTP diphosphatase [Flavobacteriaceae bacterium]